MRINVINMRISACLVQLSIVLLCAACIPPAVVTLRRKVLYASRCVPFAYFIHKLFDDSNTIAFLILTSLSVRKQS